MKKLILIISVFFIEYELNAQGFGIGASSPSEILHLKKNGDVAVRFQGATAGSSSLGAQAPTANTTGVLGSKTWSSGGNVYSNNASYATVATGTSEYLVAKTFDFSAIPAGATIDGIQVSVDRSRTDATDVALLDAWGFDSDGTYSYAVSAGTNRCLILIAGMGHDAGDRDLTAVTYGGVSMTEVTSAATSNGEETHLEIWYLGEAGIAAATSSNFAFTWSGGFDAQIYAVASFQYVDQASPVADFETIGSTSTATLTFSSTLAVEDGDMVVLGALAGDDTDDNIDGDFTDNNFTCAGYTEGGDISVDNGNNPNSEELQMACYTKAISANGTENPSVITNVAALRNFNMVGLVLNSVRTVYDNSIKLVKADGTIAGTDKAATSTNWPTADATATYGGSSDLWGISWTEADVKDADFGVAISVLAYNATAQIDYIGITVYYTPSGSFSNYTMGIDQTDGYFKLSGSSSLGTSDYVTVNTSGNMGINCTAPTQKLYVDGNIYATGSVLGSQAACSDRRWKTDFKPIEGALKTVLGLDGIYYNWKYKEFPAKKFTEQRQIGFIAQEVEKVYPELIFTDNEGYKYLNYASMTPVLVEAIKEQQLMIIDLQKKLDVASAKASKVDALEGRLNELQKSIQELNSKQNLEAKK
ncbi:MAG: tail fiber domain-containing protein [Bacteroidetes bacterium]|nr:tail fiber domain-containing protein [Bacteroidota bacterium]